jgi:hypothetical protein
MKPASPARPAATLIRALAAAVSAGGALTAASAAAAPADPYQPLAFLVGHYWKGTFPQSTTTDEHCFSRVYGGRFLRDEHVVHRDGKPDDFGETLYLWNAAAGQLEYLYIESGGGFIRGTAYADGPAVVFPEAPYVEGARSMHVRSRWQRAGEETYEVATEFEVDGRWVPGFSLQMQRE